MKKLFVIGLALILVISCFTLATAESEEWTCPSCEATVTGNFCSKCGAKRPEDGVWACPNCGAECTENFCSNCGTKRSDVKTTNDDAAGKIRLDLNIAFEKNAYFSTYDVKLFVDDEWITTMRHGIDYAGSLYIDPGKHTIRFQEDSSTYPSQGSTILNIKEASLYKCKIQAKLDTIQISSERTEAITDGRSMGSEEKIFKVDGNIKLQTSIEFKKNGMFSQYDVDMYCDDTYIATLPHGKNFEGALLVSKGSHMIAFYKSGSREVRGTCSIKVDQNSSFSCKIEAERNKVDIRNDKLTY